MNLFLSLLILAVSCIYSFPTGCPDNEWQCTDGTCIAKTSRCDNFPDCNDGSDELKCTVSPVCLEGLESCPQPNGTTVCVKKAVGCGCGKVPDIDHGNVISTSDLIGSSANVTCDAGYLPSISIIICQVTGLWETASCLPKDCGAISKIPNGVIRLVDNNTTFGASGFITCNFGYHTLTPNISCQENGTWSIAVCSVIDCGPPAAHISFGKITLPNNSSTTVGASASVTCVDRYTPSKQTIVCNASGVWEQVSCNFSDCGTLPEIHHGTITYNGTVSFGSTAEVECDAGYKAIKTTVLCQRSGDWETAECLPIDCGHLPVIQFGKTIINDVGNTTYGSSASVTCDRGYETNLTKILCLSSGDWQQPICKAKDCGPVGTIPFGIIKLADKYNTTFGSSGILTCDDGYETSTKNVTCGEDGVWTTAICSLKDCGYPPNISFGDIILHNNSITTVGATASVKCASTYVPSKTTVTCMDTGEWEHASCDFQGCDSIPYITNGKITHTGRANIGSTAEVRCDAGYKASKSFVSCQRSGDWEMTECLLIDCGHLPVIQFGQINIDGVGNTTYGSSATVLCDTGFETNQTKLFCQTSGEWQTSICKPKDCGSIPTITNGNLILTDSTNTTYGATASVVCDSGYHTDRPTIICLGRWQAAQCKANDCGQLPDVQFGKIHLVDAHNTAFGASARVTCDKGFESNTSTIKCTSSGVWETSICKIKDCGSPPIISNGRIQIINHETTYGSKAFVECHSKYTSNTRFVKCLATGHWGHAKCLGQSNKDRCTEEHGVCTRHIYENVRLLALKSSKCKSFCQCIHGGTSAGGIITYKWAEHQCPPGTLFDDNLISRVCNHQFMVNC
ncbi:sushi, von Willebrand factor type A, EGF and pentraxin domain-containing protein 1-like [Ruditapes philippinarum]|uniref:sushi, von Willebrand factor type A, EGF and pentraxin domain-containing protein 1-like n=1 Tax=Ruditapes philippinarum TaxID=129788 RepID=UPI00295AC227|nr:sushi, von Willebrand factor type A, EGF and pentraxin domain-containing protein 1-like [Ruditapes philippinarum]